MIIKILFKEGDVGTIVAKSQDDIKRIAMLVDAREIAGYEYGR
jgi:hypothetical protein